MLCQNPAQLTVAVLLELDIIPKKIAAARKIKGSAEFIREATPQEANSKAAQNKAFNSFPKKEGYQVVFKPYGEQGRGFY